MTGRANERVAYINGEIVPESRALVSFRDRGFKYGEAVFDTARTVQHRPFKLREHVERLFRSLRYLQLEPNLTVDEFVQISESVLEQNLHLIGPDEDYWLSQRVSAGSTDSFMGDGGDGGAAPTVIIECTPLPLAARRRCFATGSRSWCRPPVAPRPMRRARGRRPITTSTFSSPTARSDPWIPWRGRSCSITTAISPKASGATSFSCATASFSPLANDSCCPASVGRRSSIWRRRKA